MSAPGCSAAIIFSVLIICLRNIEGQSCPKVLNVAQMCVSGQFTGQRVLIDMSTYSADTDNCSCTYSTTASVLRIVTYTAPNYPECNSAIRLFSASGNNMRFQCLMSGTYLDTSIYKQGLTTFETYGATYDDKYCLVLEHAGRADDTVTVQCTGKVEPQTTTTLSQTTNSYVPTTPNETTDRPLVDNTSSSFVPVTNLTITKTSDISTASYAHPQTSSTGETSTAAIMQTMPSDSTTQYSSISPTKESTVPTGDPYSKLTTPSWDLNNMLQPSDTLSPTEQTTRTVSTDNSTSDPASESINFDITLHAAKSQDNYTFNSTKETTTAVPESTRDLVTEIVTGTILLHGKNINSTARFQNIDLLSSNAESTVRNASALVEKSIAENGTLSFTSQAYEPNANLTLSETFTNFNGTKNITDDFKIPDTVMITKSSPNTTKSTTDNQTSWTSNESIQYDGSINSTQTEVWSSNTSYENKTYVLDIPIPSNELVQNDSIIQGSNAASEQKDRVTYGKDALKQPSETVTAGMDDINQLNESVTYGLDAINPLNESLIAGMDGINQPYERATYGPDAIMPPKETVTHERATYGPDAIMPPKETVTSGMDGINQPNERATYGPDAIMPPKESVTAGMDSINQPNERATYGSDAIMPPKETVTHERATYGPDAIMPPKETVTPGMDGINQPNERVTYGPDAIMPPKENVTPGMDGITQPNERSTYGPDAIMPPEETVTQERATYGPDAIMPPKKSITAGMDGINQPNERATYGPDAIMPPKETVTPGMDGINQPNERATYGPDAIMPPKETVTPGMDGINQPNERATYGPDAIMPLKETVTPAIDGINQPNERATYGTDAIMPPKETVTPGMDGINQPNERATYGPDAMMPPKETVTPGMDGINQPNERATYGPDAIMPPKGTVTPDMDGINLQNERATYGPDAIMPPKGTVTPGMDGINQPNERATYDPDAIMPPKETVTPGINETNQTNGKATYGLDAINPLNEYVTPGMDGINQPNERATYGPDAIMPPKETVTPGMDGINQPKERATYGPDAIMPAKETVTPGINDTNQTNERATYGLDAINPLNESVTPGMGGFNQSNERATYGPDAIMPPKETVTPGMDGINQPTERASYGMDAINKTNDSTTSEMNAVPTGTTIPSWNMKTDMLLTETTNKESKTFDTRIGLHTTPSAVSATMAPNTVMYKETTDSGSRNNKNQRNDIQYSADNLHNQSEQLYPPAISKTATESTAVVSNHASTAISRGAFPTAATNRIPDLAAFEFQNTFNVATKNTLDTVKTGNSAGVTAFMPKDSTFITATVKTMMDGTEPTALMEPGAIQPILNDTAVMNTTVSETVSTDEVAVDWERAPLEITNVLSFEKQNVSFSTESTIANFVDNIIVNNSNDNNASSSQFIESRKTNAPESMAGDTTQGSLTTTTFMPTLPTTTSNIHGITNVDAITNVNESTSPKVPLTKAMVDLMSISTQLPETRTENTAVEAGVVSGQILTTEVPHDLSGIISTDIINKLNTSAAELIPAYENPEPMPEDVMVNGTDSTADSLPTPVFTEPVLEEVMMKENASKTESIPAPKYTKPISEDIMVNENASTAIISPTFKDIITTPAATNSLPDIIPGESMIKEKASVAESIPTTRNIPATNTSMLETASEEILSMEKIPVPETAPPSKEIPKTKKKYDVVVVDEVNVTGKPVREKGRSTEDGSGKAGENLNVSFGNDKDHSFFHMNNDTYIIVVACIAGLVVLAAVLGIIIHHSRKHRSDKVDISANGPEPISHQNIAYDSNDVEKGEGSVGKNGAGSSQENGNTGLTKAEDYKGNIEA